jgi:mannitol/fructose-specific phosphotransferase system IIA component (Ntr-type)
MVMFPPLVADAEEEEFQDEPGAAAPPAMPAPIPVALVATDLPSVLGHMLQAVLPQEHGALDRLIRELQQSTPVPLSPQIALLHVHTPGITSARIAVGQHPRGIPLSGFPAPPHELVLLLSPRSGSPEQHLRILAAIARAARQGSLLKQA